MDYSVVKGTHDIIQSEAEGYSNIENILIFNAKIAGFNEFRTPIIENSSLFVRSVGEGSDIVRKEMYTFKDKGDRDITLRPEMTAGVVRAMVNSKLFAQQDYPVKAYYIGPNFRYERPQAGRYRQFQQFGVESVGADSAIRDAEVILLGYNSLKMLGFSKIVLKINTLGDFESRIKYKTALVDYLSNHIDIMCDDCKERLKLNPLRILDCKVENDQKIVKDAPKLHDFLSNSSKSRFDELLEILKAQNVEFVIDESLVRGLDYYTGVVFEYSFTSINGVDVGALGGGGHYGNLVKELGGPELEGIGFAFGLERVASVLKDENLFKNEISIDAFIIPLDKKYFEKALTLASFLRVNGYSCEMNVESANINASFKKALRRNAKFAIIIGENEIKNDSVQVKNLSTKGQEEVLLSNLVEFFDRSLEDDHDHCCEENEEIEK